MNTYAQNKIIKTQHEILVRTVQTFKLKTDTTFAILGIGDQNGDTKNSNLAHNMVLSQYTFIFLF